MAKNILKGHLSPYGVLKSLKHEKEKLENFIGIATINEFIFKYKKDQTKAKKFRESLRDLEDIMNYFIKRMEGK